jgi:hypothetical protein
LSRRPEHYLRGQITASTALSEKGPSAVDRPLKEGTIWFTTFDDRVNCASHLSGDYGILNRLLEGLSDYRTNGLAVPPDLKAAAEEYCSSSDMLATFIADEIVLDDKATLGAQAFYTSYHGWCLQTSIRPMSHPQFRQEMIKTLSISPKKTNVGSIWPGIRRRTSTE